MSIQYRFEPEGDLLMVKAWGFDESLEEVERYGMAVIEACQAGRYQRVLSDETELEYRLGVFDTFQAAEFISSQAPRIKKAAVVCNEIYFQDAQFWETVAVNRGMTVRVFKDIESARNWLRETSPTL